VADEPARSVVESGRWEYLGIFAETFGYTPKQIDELTIKEFNYLIRYLQKTGRA
jgi:hypothetical protein